jgi:hypothetical protein
MPGGMSDHSERDERRCDGEEDKWGNREVSVAPVLVTRFLIDHWSDLALPPPVDSADYKVNKGGAEEHVTDK